MKRADWRKFTHPWRLAVIVSVCLILAILLLTPVQPSFALNYGENLVVSFGNMAGLGWFADIAQDFVGFRAIVHRANAYEIQAVMFREIGVTLQVGHASTHPPTAYLLTAPVAFLPYPLALSLWSALMLISIPVSMLLFGFSIPWALASVLVGLFWPPAYTALGQLTPIWLLGCAFAYRFRARIPLLSGMGIALASLTKYFPAILLLLHVRRRNWTAVLGFGLVWLAAVALLFALNPDIFSQYVTVNRTTSPEMIQRIDNGALLPALARSAGIPGLILAVILIVSVCFGVNRSDRSLWLLGCWLAVALLPIAWCYSLLPLLPILYFALKSRKPALWALVFLAGVLPCPVQYGTQAAGLVAGEVALTGLILSFLPAETEGMPIHA